MNRQLASYKNGDYTVIIFSDGTKVREWTTQFPRIRFPESIDLKITDYCDLGCKFCHEKSTRAGKHCSVEKFVNLIEGLPAGVELALGGGNPFSHPEFEDILYHAHKRGLIANVTINEKHIPQEIDRIKLLREKGHINGLGVSIDNDWKGIAFNEVRDDNTVAHVITGIHDPSIVRSLISSIDDSEKVKILLLGYKWYGRGIQYNLSNSEEINKTINKWRYFLPSFINSGRVIMSFDNLSLVQMGVQNMVHDDIWNDIYMGDDGSFTMYADCVTMSYATSSVSERHAINDRSISELFAQIRDYFPFTP